MEESIKRAEKLVHATNSALAQMKYNLTFDKAGKKEEARARRSQDVRRADKGTKSFSLGPEWDDFEKEFRADANEILSKMDKILDPSQFVSSRLKSARASKAREKMNEINRIISTRRSDYPKSPEKNQNHQKLLTLINDEDSSPRARLPSSIKSFQVNNDPSFRGQTSTKGAANTQENTKYQNRSKDDLKMNLLETEEVVDRGFQTARQLTEWVENITKKGSDLAKSDVIPTNDVINLQNYNQPRKTDSNETIKTVTSQKCPKCQRLKKKREKEMECNLEGKQTPEKTKPDRNLLLQVKSRLWDSRDRKKTVKLSLHQLPSVHIRGDLQVQKVHNLTLPGHSPQESPPKSNTFLEMLSHEHLERGKKQNLIAGIKKENSFCSKMEENLHRVECFNCGNVIPIPPKRPHPGEIDRLLQECNFNVFDPRIDEFVERWREGNNPTEPKETHTIEKPNHPNTPLSEKLPTSANLEKLRRNLKIQQLSQRLARRYKEEVDHLEDDHLEFQNILKTLFKRIDDSRKFFNFDTEPSPPKTKQEVMRKRTNLATTKPLLVCLPEEKNERNDDDPGKEEAKEKREKSTETDRTPGERRFRLRQKRKNLEKNDVKNKCRTSKEFTHKPLNLAENLREEKGQVRHQPLKPPIDTSPRLPDIGVEILREMYMERDTNGEESDNNERYKEKSHKEDKNMGQRLKEERYKGEIPKQEGNKREKRKEEGSKGERQKQETNKGERHEQERGKQESQKEENSTNSNSALNSSDSVKKDDTMELIPSDLDIRTENDYESDFERESPTFGKGSELEKPDSGAQVQDFDFIPPIKKLSTITEVDSELEKKGSSTSSHRSPKELSDSKEYDIENILAKAFKKGIAYTLQRQTNVLDTMGPDKPETVPHPTTTSRLTGNQFPEETSNPSKSPEERPKSSKSKSETSPSQKSSPTEVVASLKEVLSALKDQFARTQSLADKLTDSVKAAKEGPQGETGEEKPNSQISGDTSVKPVAHGSESGVKKSVLTFLQSGTWEPAVMENNLPQMKWPKMLAEEVSIGEVSRNDFFLPSRRSRMGAGKQQEGSSLAEGEGNGQVFWPSFAPVSGHEEDSVSEGEIVSNIIPEEGGSSMQSIGELISESLSEA